MGRLVLAVLFGAALIGGLFGGWVGGVTFAWIVWHWL